MLAIMMHLHMHGGQKKTLPTEIQLEKATKGHKFKNQDCKFWWGDNSPKNKCNFGRMIEDFFEFNDVLIGIPPVTPVTKFPPNDYGIYDACGNIWRWCLDSFSEKKPKTKN